LAPRNERNPLLSTMMPAGVLLPRLSKTLFPRFFNTSTLLSFLPSASSPKLFVFPTPTHFSVSLTQTAFVVALRDGFGSLFLCCTPVLPPGVMMVGTTLPDPKRIYEFLFFFSLRRGRFFVVLDKFSPLSSAPLPPPRSRCPKVTNHLPSSNDNTFSSVAKTPPPFSTHVFRPFSYHLLHFPNSTVSLPPPINYLELSDFYSDPRIPVPLVSPKRCLTPSFH